MRGRRLARLGLLALLGACASPGGGGAPAPALEGMAFAPSLEVDLATMQRTPGGVRYQDIAVGDGPLARRGSIVTVHYVAWLPDGTAVETSTQGAPVQLTLGERQAIRGWEEGISGMRPGGQRRLVVPPNLAYRHLGKGAVPPNAVLVFEIQLLSVR